MSCTLCTKQGIPCIRSSTTNNACDACRQAHKKCLFIVRPFRPQARGVPAQDALARTPLWSTMMKPFLSVNGRRGPEQANGIDCGQ
ncbi:hypothetical protein O181_091141 [Austropuccinia psidii MF-1]|uniref:Zn(2)-C6 fungal-type domain-containing protein n=1 Tax=Austropuccinia psidii MF-1 TaxID=1389203 RepID=A0A9Q3IWU9_9BASI|nr:hypothetical protein [Austropuccinia psidii MF-1]